MRVDVGDGASMPLPDHDVAWHLRYGDKVGRALAAAELIDAYHYLVEECSQKEAWRRIKLIRAKERLIGAV